jgi:superfamily II DNA or RNA helicase
MPADRRDLRLSSCDHGDEIAKLQRQVAAQERALAELRREVAALRSEPGDASSVPRSGLVTGGAVERGSARVARSGAGGRRGSPSVTQGSSGETKIALFRRLFAGRDDVYARRWENASKGTSGWSPAHGGSWNTPRDQRQYLPLTDEVVRGHLEGRDTVGLYPLLVGDTCRLLVCDFDKSSWKLDAQAYVEAADAVHVPTAVEISRSGNGAHVWTFFTAPVAASQARALGAGLLRETMARRGELDLESYDRFFPSQDYVPERGFGNLIALPLQGECRFERGTTVFVDPRTFEPFDDQFVFLSSLVRMTPAEVERVVDELRPVAVGPDTRLYRSSVRADVPPPETIDARLAGMLAVRRAGIPPGLYATLKHLATLHNPAFHRNENLRLSNHATPRFIRCYVEDLEYLYLPRGLVDQAAAIVEEAGSRLLITDERPEPAPIDLAFDGEFRAAQEQAVEVMSGHELGVLDAPPGTGKTVMACALIARHATPTLVLVDRKPLLAQWRERLATHLGVDAGQIGGGKQRQTKIVDIAMVQTVTRNERAADLLDGYGLVVIDECHHVPAPTVERAVRNLDARRWLGLTATPQRPDGLKDIMVMQCGPIRHRITQGASDLDRRLQVHRTELTIDDSTEGLTRGEVLALINASLVEDDRRNEQICRDVAAAVGAGRNCLVLSSRTEHVDVLAGRLSDLGLEPLVLYGSLRSAQRRAVHERLAEDRQLLLVATDRYIGEGFDCPKLDTLFLAFPISARQRITQYVGRILRDQPGKDVAEVHDYLDAAVPMLAAMHRRRLPGYKQLGFTPAPPTWAPVASAPPPERGSSAVSAGGSSEAAGEPTTAQVRAWARAHGHAVSDRGRLPAALWEAYREAHR